MLCSTSLHLAASGHSIPFLHRAAGLGTLHWPCWGGRPQRPGTESEFSLIFTIRLSAPQGGRSCSEIPLVSCPMSGCFSLSSLDKNCQGDFLVEIFYSLQGCSPDSFPSHPRISLQGNLLSPLSLAASSTKWDYQHPLSSQCIRADILIVRIFKM